MNEQIPQSYVKSSQVKSSQVKFKMAVANPPPLVPLAGASDREGRTRRNWHHCALDMYLCSPESGHRGQPSSPSSCS